jgi:protein deglycase
MKKVLLLLADGFEVLEASAFIDIFGWNFAEGDNSTELFTCGLRKEIKSSFNQRFIVDHLVSDVDVDSYDALAVPGGFEVYGYYNDAYDDAFLDIIRRFKANNNFIASICVGALPLAKSGVLKGKNGTTYNSAIRREALQRFGVNVTNQSVVVDDSMITSIGPSTALDVAFMLLEHLTSRDNVVKVRRLMGFKDKKPDGGPVFIQVVDRPARKLIVKRGIKSTHYFEYCDEVGCDVWEVLTGIKEAINEPMGLWLPDNLRNEGTSIYAQGVEVAADYSGNVPDGYDVIDLSPCKMMIFQGEPYDDESFPEAIGSLQETIRNFNPGLYGYKWADADGPRFQLEPLGHRGYIEGRPVRVSAT